PLWGGLCLPAGDVVLDEVRVLEAQVLDREPVLEVADHPAGGLADGDLRANARPLVGGDGTTRLRNVYDTHGNVVAVKQGQPPGGDPGRHPAVAAVVDRAQELAVGQPGELGSQLVALARGGCDVHGEAIFELARHHAFEPADVIHIGDDALIELSDHR